MNSQEAPVKVGEIHEVEIKSVGEKGDGIARVNGFVLFVPSVKKGDYVKIKVTKVLPKVGFEIINLGDSNPIKLGYLIGLIEANLGKAAKIRLIEKQKGKICVF